MNQLTEAVVTIFVGLTSIAILAVLVSRRSDTKGVIGALFKGYSSAVDAAVSPVTGSPGFAASNFQFGGNDY